MSIIPAPYKSKLFCGNFTLGSSTANGTIVITGVGFKPKALIMIGAIAGDSDSPTWGFVKNAGDEFYLAINGGSWNVGAVGIVTRISSSAGNGQNLALVSYDVDGFTLSNAKIGSPAGVGVYGFIAIG